MLRALFALSALLACVGVQAACPANQTCLHWVGNPTDTAGVALPTVHPVTYTVLNGPKGGPYVSLAAYNGGPSQTFDVQITTPPAPKTCFVVTATAYTAGATAATTSAASAEACDAPSPPPPPPTNGSVVPAPTNGSIVH